MLALGEICFGGMGELKRGCEVLAMGEMCFQGIMLKRGFEVLALGEMCFEGMGAIEKGV